MENNKINRINELSRLARERNLTPEEETERIALRQEYVSLVRNNLKATLDNTTFVDPNGKKVKCSEKTDKPSR